VYAGAGAFPRFAGWTGGGPAAPAEEG